MLVHNVHNAILIEEPSTTSLIKLVKNGVMELAYYVRHEVVSTFPDKILLLKAEELLINKPCNCNTRQ